MRCALLCHLFFYSLIGTAKPRDSTLVIRESVLDVNTINPNRYASYLIDTSGQFTLESIKECTSSFSAWNGEIPISQWKHPVWVRFLFENDTEVLQNYLFSIGLHQFAQVFVLTEGQVSQQAQLGNQLPLYDRAVVDTLAVHPQQYISTRVAPPGNSRCIR